MSHTQNHYFGSFYEGGRSLPRLQLHLTRGTGSDDRRDLLAANRNLHFRHQAADTNGTDSPHQLVTPAAAADYQIAFLLRSASGSEKQPVHFTFRNAVMSPGGPYAANLLLVNPLFNSREADPQL